MQIHELDTFIGEMSNSVYFAVDDGTETSKVPASNVVLSIDTIKSVLVDYFYPVGSYYETSDDNFDPNTAWHGTWVREIAGQVHVSAGAGYPVAGATLNESDGGEATHTLTVDEMPNHTHKDGTSASVVYAGTVGTNTAQVALDPNSGRATTATGGGQPHNNMQPYINVHRWHRTA